MLQPLSSGVSHISLRLYFFFFLQSGRVGGVSARTVYADTDTLELVEPSSGHLPGASGGVLLSLSGPPTVLSFSGNGLTVSRSREEKGRGQ